MTPRRYLTPRQAAKELGLSYPTMLKHIRDGLIGVVLVADRQFLPRTEVEKYDPRATLRAAAKARWTKRKGQSK